MQQLISGRRPVLEALKGHQPVEKILVQVGSHGSSLDRIRELAEKKHIPITEISKQQFAELGATGESQGVAAVIATRSYVPVDAILAAARKRGEPAFLLVLDEIEDPHNLGALLRTAEAAGVHGVILPKHHSAPLSAVAIKASAGAALHLPIARVTNMVRALEELQGEGVWVVGTDAAADSAYDEFDFARPIAIVIGNEGKGIRRLVKERCDALVTIPMYGTVESLNASVAGGLVLFAAARARHRRGQ